MNLYKLSYPFLILLLIACHRPPKNEDLPVKDHKYKALVAQNNLAGTPIFAEADILSNFRKFWDYYSRSIELHEDFVAFDLGGKVIDKAKFLGEIKSGKYFPLALHSKDEQLNYKLAKIPANADIYISSYMKQFGTEQLAFYHMQGKPAPEFNFTDVNGEVYTSANTKGKIVLFKCWYIGCVACIAEMPALNQMVERYNDRDDILFISLAIDNKKNLQRFLSTTKFDYATVPNQAKYMADQLHVMAYPTHFLIDKKGNIVRALPDEVQVAEALEKEIAK